MAPVITSVIAAVGLTIGRNLAVRFPVIVRWQIVFFWRKSARMFKRTFPMTPTGISCRFVVSTTKAKPSPCKSGPYSTWCRPTSKKPVANKSVVEEAPRMRPNSIGKRICFIYRRRPQIGSQRELKISHEIHPNPHPVAICGVLRPGRNLFHLV
jgi:hypothetical protein